MLAGLLVVGSLVLSAFNLSKDNSSQLIGGIHHCFIHLEDDNSPWAQHLRESVPPDLKKHILFRKLDSDLGHERTITYPTGSGAIQIRNAPPHETGKPRYIVWLWHPSNERSGMAVYEQWFWRESYRFFHAEASKELEKAGVDVAKVFPTPDLNKDELWEQRLINESLRKEYADLGQSKGLAPLPDLDMQESSMSNSALDMRAAIATALVMFALFFTCVYLMPSLTCEERERGLLLAQVLSPARTREILAAKFLFYPAFGILLATLLAGIHNPIVLTKVYFWIALLSLAVGSLGIGTTISSLARTQRSASLAALCYMLVVALVLLICQQNNIPYIPYLALEFHAPQVLHAVLTNQFRPEHWLNIVGCCVLAFAWLMAAGFLFRKRGWQ